MQLTFLASFLGGLVSFLSPCVLPIIPGFLAYLAGASLQDAKTHRREIFLASLFFVLGFSAVFSLLGVLLSTVLDRIGIAYEVQLWLSRLGGTIIIIFGLFLMRLIRIPYLERGHTIPVTRQFSSRYLTAFLFGAAFAAGWTPCVGAILGGILALALVSPGSAFMLLFAYSLGLGLPFLLVGLFASQVSGFLARHASALGYISVGFGAVLVILGILAFTQNLSLIANLEFLNNLLLK